MARRIIALGCLVAGVWLLAGPGWALLAAGALVEVAWPRDRASVPGWAGQAARRAREAGAVARRAAERLAATARAVPRQMAAVGATAAGAALVPAGVGLIAGAGAALLVLGTLAILFGLLLDRAA